MIPPMAIAADPAAATCPPAAKVPIDQIQPAPAVLTVSAGTPRRLTSSFVLKDGSVLAVVIHATGTRGIGPGRYPLTPAGALPRACTTCVTLATAFADDGPGVRYRALSGQVDIHTLEGPTDADGLVELRLEALSAYAGQVRSGIPCQAQMPRLDLRAPLRVEGLP